MMKVLTQVAWVVFVMIIIIYRFLSDEDITVQQYNQMTINRLNQLGSSNNQESTYSGILYGSYIKTDDNEIKLIEYNSRLGDPETMVVFSLLESSIY